MYKHQISEFPKDIPKIEIYKNIFHKLTEKNLDIKEKGMISAKVSIIGEPSN